MKKISLILALLFLGAELSRAQAVHFGIRGGGNMATVASPVSDNSDVLFGLNGGVFAEFGLDNDLTFQPEVQYTMKGIQYYYSQVGIAGPSGPIVTYTNASYTYSYNYLEIPLLMKLHTPLSPSAVGSLILGPSFSFLLSGNEHYSIQSPSMSGDTALQGLTGLDMGLMVGAGLELDPVLIDLRYDRGLTGVYQGFGKSTNSVLSLDLGFRLL